MNLFKGDNIVRKVLIIMTELMYVIFLALIFCLPVVTAGASLTAMHNVLLKVVRREVELVRRSFWESFKANFRQATLIWLIVLGIAVLFYVDLRLINVMGTAFPMLMKLILICVIIFVFMMLQYIFPLLSHFENTIGGTLRNAFLLVFAEFPRTFAMTLCSLSPLLVIYILGYRSVPTILLFGLAGPGALCALFYSKVFKKLEPKEEQEA